MYYKSKNIEVSNIKQIEDKYFRFDYGKTTFDGANGIRGAEEKIKDCR